MAHVLFRFDTRADWREPTSQVGKELHCLPFLTIFAQDERARLWATLGSFFSPAQTSASSAPQVDRKLTCQPLLTIFPKEGRARLWARLRLRLRPTHSGASPSPQVDRELPCPRFSTVFPKKVRTHLWPSLSPSWAPILKHASPRPEEAPDLACGVQTQKTSQGWSFLTFSSRAMRTRLKPSLLPSLALPLGNACPARQESETPVCGCTPPLYICSVLGGVHGTCTGIHVQPDCMHEIFYWPSFHFSGFGHGTSQAALCGVYNPCPPLHFLTSLNVNLKQCTYHFYLCPLHAPAPSQASPPSHVQSEKNSKAWPGGLAHRAGPPVEWQRRSHGNHPLPVPSLPLLSCV